ncbi:hypothetical protein A2482_02395 [Candidatus Falkowbacteria bacterium RIFOXYC2_FULL_48_21]|uniref:Uncharacterized protein n=1 Tax=Candidatus Falkowbacteria bacterium RIFOXYC2_FULL_48_21 TaxID=1798005 RepID=A0A1F5TG43_9BACT|nr:MAG: hypothetical protein A2482_02395 [Candidatus Falkowbacteria bacterium RIFOXYC2_FULL_48_21]
MSEKDATQGLTDRQQIQRLIKGHFDEFDQRQELLNSLAEAVAKLIATEFAARIGQRLDPMFKPKKVTLSIPIAETVNAASIRLMITCTIPPEDLISKVNEELKNLFHEIDQRLQLYINTFGGHYNVILFPELEGIAEEEGLCLTLRREQ